MPLSVWTARLHYRGSDRLDITRNGRDPVGHVFAPSERLVELVKETSYKADSYKSWKTYEREYSIEMGTSYLSYRKVWESVLSRDLVTLVCYCSSPTRCHRSLLAKLLEEQGAVYLGERDASERDNSEREAFDLMLDLPQE